MSNCYLIDSSIYVFRGWFVLPDSMVDIKERPVNALIGFSDIVYDFLANNQVEHIAFAFDESLGQCVRRAIYPEYKANRPPAPEELKYQFQQCRRFIELLGMTQLADGQYEADDIIGTLAHQARASGQQVHILTGDKDLTQLIEEGDTWWDFARQRRWTDRQIKKHWGVRPDQIADLLAIAGDKVDNIPGIPGVGAATAAKLLNKFDTLEDLLAQSNEIHTMKTRGAKRLQQLVQDHQDIVEVSRRLTGIFCDMALEDVSTARRAPDEEELRTFFEDNNFGNSRTKKWLDYLRG